MKTFGLDIVIAIIHLYYRYLLLHFLLLSVYSNMQQINQLMPQYFKLLSFVLERQYLLNLLHIAITVYKSCVIAQYKTGKHEF